MKNWKDWCKLIGVVIVATIVTWIGLNIGRMLYDDWAFLHTARLVTEQQQLQQRQQAQPAPTTQPAPSPK